MQKICSSKIFLNNDLKLFFSVTEFFFIFVPNFFSMVERPVYIKLNFIILKISNYQIHIVGKGGLAMTYVTFKCLVDQKRSIDLQYIQCIFKTLHQTVLCRFHHFTSWQCVLWGVAHCVDHEKAFSVMKSLKKYASAYTPGRLGLAQPEP